MKPKNLYQFVLVDDEEAHRLIAKRAIKNHFQGSYVTEASGVNEAITIIGSDQHHSDIIILDFNLGQESGLSVLENIRQTRKPNEAIVVIVSTSTLLSDIERSYLLGANCYLFKSSDTKEYQSNLAHALRFFLS